VSAEDLPDSVVQEKRELFKQFKRWSVAFEAFLTLQSETEVVEHRSSGPNKANGKLQHGAVILQIHHRLALMFFSASLPEENSVFAALPNPDADFILRSAEFLLRSSQKGSLIAAASAWSPPLRRSFSSEMGIVAPLSLLALKCQDPYVCEKSVALLAASNRREGLIDAHMVLGMLERVAALKQKEEITPLVAAAAKRSAECAPGNRHRYVNDVDVRIDATTCLLRNVLDATATSTVLICPVCQARPTHHDL
jgi:hypothetical protein